MTAHRTSKDSKTYWVHTLFTNHAYCAVFHILSLYNIITTRISHMLYNHNLSTSHIQRRFTAVTVIIMPDRRQAKVVAAE